MSQQLAITAGPARPALPAGPRPAYIPGTRRVLRAAQHRIDQIWAGAIGRHHPALAFELSWGVFLEAGRELDRLAAKVDRLVYLDPHRRQS